MKYLLLLWPHANVRYRQATMPLARFELETLLSAAGVAAVAREETLLGQRVLAFEADALSADALSLLRRHSLCYMGAACRSDGTLEPLWSRRSGGPFEALSGLYKYRGKTNENFTRFLINMAAFHGVGSSRADAVVFDPMCGRGTTLFEALDLGYRAWGADIRKADLTEGENCLRRYLEENRLRHRVIRSDRTIPTGGHVPVCEFRIGDGGEARFFAGDAAQCAQSLGRERVDALVCDLPYGVQHGPGQRESLEELLRRTLKAAAPRVRQGGAAALAFNTHTLKLRTVRGALEEAGFEALAGGLADRLSHRVEQAILRDVAIGIKR